MLPDWRCAGSITHANEARSEPIELWARPTCTSAPDECEARQALQTGCCACSKAGAWLDQTGVFSEEASHVPAVTAATALWYATLASTQLAGKALGVSCATPGVSSLVALGGVATASVFSAQASRSVSSWAKPLRNRRSRTRPGEFAARRSALCCAAAAATAASSVSVYRQCSARTPRTLMCTTH